jgi:hypothetical protein
MPVATITLESSNGDSVVVSAPDDAFLVDDIILDTDPKGAYDAGFTARTQSGAFEVGGRITGQSIPIREMTLPFWLTPASRPRFQKLWGTPSMYSDTLERVRWHYDGPSGRRSLTLKLAKQIDYTTEDGFDADIDDVYHAVVSAIAVNPMFEGVEDVSEWVNSGNFTIYTNSSGGTFKLAYGGSALTPPLAWNASTATVRTALAALPSIGGVGNVTVSGSPGKWTVITPTSKPGMLTVDGSGLAPLDFTITIGGLTYSLAVGGQTTTPLSFFSSASTLQTALEQLSTVGTGGVSVSATFFGFTLNFSSGPLSGFLAALFMGKTTGIAPVIRVAANPNQGWFDVWNPTDQPLWLEWELDPAVQWQFPDHSFGNERRWGRAVGEDAARMIVTPQLVSMLSVMSDPFMDTYVSADLSNIAGLFNGVEPIYMVPPGTGTEVAPILMPVVCNGPSGAKATLRQRRFWSAEAGLD